jgi:alpha-D-ribose 1-methylphosphonate 5-triphosphate synthase subunit PhnI
MDHHAFSCIDLHIALAIKQASGDLVEAIFLLRAYRTTLPRLLSTVPVDTAHMVIERRISATFKDLPGGQILGATYDYTQRLLDFSLAAEESVLGNDAAAEAKFSAPQSMPRVLDFLNAEGLIETEMPPHGDPAPSDLTREPLQFPAEREARLQNLARGDEGFLLALGYSTQRGYANNHPFAGEIRYGKVAVEVVAEELGFAIDIGDIELTECQMVNQFAGSHTEAARFTRGYGLTFGHGERKAMAMALVDRALRRTRAGRGNQLTRANGRVCPVPLRQCRSFRLRPAFKTSALRRGQIAVVERAFAHYPRYRKRHLFPDLHNGQLRHGCVAAPCSRQRPVRFFDGLFAAVDCYIHGDCSAGK